MDDEVRAEIDGEWERVLGVDRSLIRSGGVHVVTADLGANDALSVLLDSTCIVVVEPEMIAAARDDLFGMSVDEAFTAETLRLLVGEHAQVDGPSRHSYVTARSVQGATDPAVTRVSGDDPRLLAFLDGNDLAEWAESGFPRDPITANPATTQFWLLEEDDGVAVAGNLTEWRGHPADVGVLTHPQWRGRGLAARLVGAMVANALPAVGIVRYRALASNTASLSVARRLGFEPYGQNFRARRSAT